MSLTVVRTGAGAEGRGGSTGWPLDGSGWYMLTSQSCHNLSRLNSSVTARP
jgi:hypothetical protein